MANSFAVQPLPPEADRVLILVNPKAGARSARERVDRSVVLLRERGVSAEVFTDLAQVALEADRQHQAGRLRALVGVGGDGTAAELVNRTRPGVPLTMLPAGNENLLARHLGLGNTPEALCRTIADGGLIRLDAGSAAGRIFLLMASCGFDAEVVRRLHARRTGHVRSLTYVKPIWETIRSYQYPEIRVYWDGACGPRDGLVLPGEGGGQAPSAVLRWLFAFNLPCYGGGLRLAPQADAADGRLDVCGFSRGSLWDGLRYAAAVYRGRHQALPDCLTHRASRLRITSDAEVPYQLDGDPGGVLPVDIEVLPGRLTLVAGRQ